MHVVTAALRRNAFDPKAEVASGTLERWYDATQIVGIADGGAVATLTNLQGTAGRDLGQATAGRRPTFRASGARTLNGLPSIDFDGTDDLLTGLGMTGLSGAEAFIVFKAANDPGVAGTQGLWLLGNGVSMFPETNGIIYDSFCTTARKQTVNPGTSLTLPTVYNVTSVAGEWTQRINGTQTYTTASNVVSFTSDFTIGQSEASTRFGGVFGELLIYGAKLSDADRAAVTAYLGSKWQVAVA